MKLLNITVICALLLVSCKPSVEVVDNPLLQDYTTPYEIPPFDEIKNEHFLPAFKSGIEQQLNEIDAITGNKEIATFENTVAALDRSGKILDKVGLVFYNLSGTDNSDTLQEINREVTPLLTKLQDDIAMNKILFARIKDVYETRYGSKLDSSQQRTVEKYYSDFVRNGANLSNEDQDSLRVVNEKIADLILKFGENQLAETNDNFLMVVNRLADLEGLPQSNIDAAAIVAKEKGHEGKWAFTLQKPSWIPFLKYAKNRALREQIYKAYYMRGDNGDEFDNNEVVLEIANLRAVKAKLLGYSTYAHYVIEQNMAKTPAQVNDFLNELWMPALNRAKEELKEMQAIADNEGAGFKLESWDWWYYADKLRKEKYDLDESELTPYFKLSNVRDGLLWVATQLYGITFKKVDTLPIYHSDVETYKVMDKDGSHLGIVFFDYFPRGGKRPGAWCTSFRPSSITDGIRKDPLVSIVCNFTKPTDNLPSLLTWDEVTTLFHEFGHGLHGLFETGKYQRIIGDVERDYVELPSQIMENWAAEPQVLKYYARHYETNEPIPDELIAKITNSALFNQGFMTVEYMAASILDMDWHMITTEQPVINTEEFEQKSMGRIGLIKEIIPRYRSTYFAHIFRGGYAAGYYVYIWAAVLDADAFNAFSESGDIFNQELANKFRKYCLTESGEGDGMEMYMKFRGQEPDVNALLSRRGLN